MKRALAAVFLLLIIGAAAWSYIDGGIVWLLLDPSIPSEIRIAEVREYFAAWGPAGPLAYMFVVVIEVLLAPIPGTVLYLPGGVVFGWLVGGAMSLAGNVIGAGIACQLMRTLGSARFRSFFRTGSLEEYEAAISRRGCLYVFLLRANPLTSSDLVSYAAGLTRMPVWKVMLGTFLGMAPLCFVQAYFAQELFTVFPGLLYPLIVLGAVYLLVAVRLIRRVAAEARVQQATGATPSVRS